MNKQVLFVLLAGSLAMSACIAPIQRPAAESPVESVATPMSAGAMSEPAQAAAYGAAWQSVACDTFDVAPEIAERADCGYVTVPENRAAGTPNTIQLGVVRVHSTSNNPGAPLFDATGGPGGAGLEAAATGRGASFLTDKSPILADRDWVFFTQRGTALSIPELGCPAFDFLAAQGAIEGWTLEERGVRSRDALLACASELTAQGIDLAGYNSNENAADVDSIRQALGYDKIIYYGESYGTLLGQFVLRNHPEILESIILDGIAPASAKRVSEVTNIPGAFQNVFAACAADSMCDIAYPDLENVLVEAIGALRENPVSTQVNVGGTLVPLVVDDLLAMNSLFIQLYMPGGYAKLPSIVYQLSNGDLSGLNFSIPAYLAVSSSARVMHYAINCSDDPLASLADAGLDGMPQIYAGMSREDAEKYALICPALALPQLPDSSDEVVESDLPALLLQGGMDPATPVVGGNNVQTGLPSSFMAVVPAGAHIQSGNPCVIEIMRAFMNDPQTAPDISCIDSTLPFAFAGPVEYVDEASGNAVRAHLPPTWLAIGPGQWSNGDMLLILSAYDVAKSVGDLYAETVQLLGANDPELADGPEIAGLPTLTFQGALGGLPMDVYLLGDAGGTYRVAVQFQKPDQIEQDRARAEALFRTISVGDK